MTPRLPSSALFACVAEEKTSHLLLLTETQTNTKREDLKTRLPFPQPRLHVFDLLTPRQR